MIIRYKKIGSISKRLAKQRKYKVRRRNTGGTTEERVEEVLTRTGRAALIRTLPQLIVTKLIAVCIVIKKTPHSTSFFATLTVETTAFSYLT